MKLTELSMTNFRGYEEASISLDEDMNVIIGRNDVGKSTILDALEIFFNGENRDAQVKIEREDLNVNCEDEDDKNKEIHISCIFDVEDQEIIIDSTNKTNFKDEFLLNREKRLEVIKVWNCDKTKIGASDLQIYLKSCYPKIKEPLLNLTDVQLRKKLKDIKDEINYEAVDKTKNAEMRKAIHDHYISQECGFEDTYINLKKATGKDMWKAIKNNLPLYFLFKSDRSNTDTDAEVQDPLKIATKEALAGIQEQLSEIEETVESYVKRVGQVTIEKLKEFDEGIAYELRTELSLRPWDSIFSFALVSDKNIPLNKRGSGIRRLMLLSYFRAEAERVVEQEPVKRSIIYAIEEPETSQHPDFQRMIIESLNTLSTNRRRQIIITTHTPEIAKLVKVDQLIFIKRDMNNVPHFEKEAEKKIKGIIETLGILPTIMSGTVICVEGYNDVNFIASINSNIPELRNIIDLKKGNIKIMPLYGNNLIDWVDKNYLENSSLREIHLYDGDLEEYKDKVNKMNKDNDGRRRGFTTIKREIENYIDPELIEKRWGIDLGKYKKTWDNENVPEVIMNEKYRNEQITAEERKKKIDHIKRILNRELSRKISKENLENIDGYKEVEGACPRSRGI